MNGKEAIFGYNIRIERCRNAGISDRSETEIERSITARGFPRNLNFRLCFTILFEANEIFSISHSNEFLTELPAVSKLYLYRIEYILMNKLLQLRSLVGC